jgi:hypothetical protein
MITMLEPLGFALKRKVTKVLNCKCDCTYGFSKANVAKRFEIPNSSEVAWIITSPL